MSFCHDPELPAGYQDADLEQAAMEAEGNRIAAAERRGICTHGSAVGYRSPSMYPEQEGLKPGQLRCTSGVGGCRRVFGSDEEWYQAMAEAAGR